MAKISSFIKIAKQKSDKVLNKDSKPNANPSANPRLQNSKPNKDQKPNKNNKDDKELNEMVAQRGNKAQKSGKGKDKKLDRDFGDEINNFLRNNTSDYQNTSYRPKQYGGVFGSYFTFRDANIIQNHARKNDLMGKLKNGLVGKGNLWKGGLMASSVMAYSGFGLGSKEPDFMDKDSELNRQEVEKAQSDSLKNINANTIRP